MVPDPPSVPPFLVHLVGREENSSRCAHYTLRPLGPNQKKPRKSLVCFADQISFSAFQPGRANSLATSKRCA